MRCSLLARHALSARGQGPHRIDCVQALMANAGTYRYAHLTRKIPAKKSELLQKRRQTGCCGKDAQFDGEKTYRADSYRTQGDYPY